MTDNEIIKDINLLRAYEKGYQEGYKAGRQDHIKELDQENDIQRWRKSGHP